MAVCLFRCCDRSVSTRTRSPEGLWTAITHELVLFRCWPPAPEPLVAVNSTSRRLSVAICSALASSTATVTVEVWTRPLLSVGGMRCQRCPPASSRNCAAPDPLISIARKPSRRSRTARSKTLPHCSRSVGRQHVTDEQFRVVATFSRSDLKNVGIHALSLPRVHDRTG